MFKKLKVTCLVCIVILFAIFAIQGNFEGCNTTLLLLLIHLILDKRCSL